jgi:hypothetical protein
MIAGVINQTICTANKFLFKEVVLNTYGVDCTKGLWKTHMSGYLLMTLNYSTCDNAYAVVCAIAESTNDLVTEKICVDVKSIAALICAGSVTDIPLVRPQCNTITIEELN